ncbi:molecular chaperone [Acidovorax sp. sic0104]|uniref:fimbrial biogenesis chaperone n=1 Tax=Acidovorax sp. sic0104 TaxID=2854784 RepID=UPI0021071B1A|nr:fimbria/pilus periplasmic chaperone [Acidovorax sp. sic0104]
MVTPSGLPHPWRMRQHADSSTGTTARNALRYWLCTLWLVMACAAPARAATPLMIWPVDPMITEQQQAVAVWVENRGVAAVSLQVRVMDWSQTEGEEFLSSQKEILASPPISVIPPGKRQMIRLIASHPVPPELEVAYRVLIDELPAPDNEAQATTQDAAGMGIRLKVRYAIPLFVYGSGAQPFRATHSQALRSGKGKPLPPDLTWTTVKEGKVHRLVVRNKGRGHARITAVRWGTRAPRPDITVNEGLMGYVLPNSQMKWDLEAPPPGDPVLKANINGHETLVPRGAE